MPVKLKDVAEAAGVATNTASSILNSRKDSWASEETKKRVFEIAKKLGYTPNRIARGLSLGKFNTVGLIIPDLHNPFYSALITEIEAELIKRDHDLIIEDTHLDFLSEKLCLNKIINRQIDGIIINPINPDIFKAQLEPLARSGTAITVLGEIPKGSQLNSVRVDLQKSVDLTIRYLAEQGHKKIGFILHEVASHQKPTPRIARFKETLTRYRLESPTEFLVQCKPTMEAARNAFKALLNKHPKESLPTAFVCLNDLLAIGTIRAASESGLNIPGDISIVGVDNIPVAEFLTVSLTTISQPIRQMAIHAVESVLNEASTIVETVLHGELIIRESTGQAPVR